MANIGSAVPPAFNPVRYVPARRQEVISALPVYQITAVAHEKISWGNRFTNHWCLYLQTSESASVSIDCQPSHSVPSTVTNGGSKGFLIVSELDEPFSRDATKVVTLAATADLTVGHVVQALMNSGRHRYEFT